MTPVAVSAHKGGAEGVRAATMEAYESAVTTGAEYVEFDIRRTRDGELVVYHDARVARTGPRLAEVGYDELVAAAGYPVPRVRAVMKLIAGRARGHLDLKEVGDENEVITMALDVLGLEGFVATTLEDASVATIKSDFPDVVTALSLGRDRRELSWFAVLPTRARELYPLRRMRACGADWLAVEHRLARAGVLRACTRAGVPAMVWTVDEDAALARFLGDERVSVLVTDRPRHAVGLRAARSEAHAMPATDIA